LMISTCDSECLCDFPRAGAKLSEIVNATASLHQFDPSPGLKRTNQNKAVSAAFHQHVQHPMSAVIEIDVSRAGFATLDEATRDRAGRGVRSFVINCRRRFHFDDDA